MAFATQFCCNAATPRVSLTRYNASEYSLNAIISSIVKEYRLAEMNVELWNRKRTFQYKFVFHKEEKKTVIKKAERCTRTGKYMALSLKDKFFILLCVV